MGKWGIERGDGQCKTEKREREKGETFQEDENFVGMAVVLPSLLSRHGAAVQLPPQHDNCRPNTRLSAPRLSLSLFPSFPFSLPYTGVDFCRPGNLLCHKHLRQEKAVMHRLSPMCHRRSDRKSLKRSCLPAASNYAGAWGAGAKTQNSTL